jgi:hypothetical protein
MEQIAAFNKLTLTGLFIMEPIHKPYAFTPDNLKGQQGIGVNYPPIPIN